MYVWVHYLKRRKTSSYIVQIYYKDNIFIGSDNKGVGCGVHAATRWVQNGVHGLDWCVHTGLHTSHTAGSRWKPTLFHHRSVHEGKWSGLLYYIFVHHQNKQVKSSKKLYDSTNYFLKKIIQIKPYLQNLIFCIAVFFCHLFNLYLNGMYLTCWFYTLFLVLIFT